MKKYIYSIVILTLLTFKVQSQSANNFVQNNCKGENFNLFSELDNGNTVILLFEKQSNACVVASNNVEKFYKSLDSNKVKCFYIDVLKGSKCSDVEKWKLKNKLSLPAFADGQDYISNLTTTTPHIIIAAGVDHKIYYSGIWNAALIKSAVDSASKNAKSINPPLEFSNVNIVSSPNGTDKLLNFTINQSAKVLVELIDDSGKSIKTFLEERIDIGTRTLVINTFGIKAGNYIVSIVSGNVSAKAPLNIQ
jgi:hypothetical protein